MTSIAKPLTARPPSFSKLCNMLGAPMKNRLDRWCGYASDYSRIALTTWADHLMGDRYVFWRHNGNDLRRGAKELGEVIPKVMSRGGQAFGILCVAKNTQAETRSRARFDRDHLLILRLEHEDGDLVGYVEGEVTVAELLKTGSVTSTTFPSASNDLDAPPLGVDNPDRVKGVVTGYRRDDKVRAWVIRNAEGICEHCGSLGFPMPSGRNYLEAHHVIALAADGPDKASNVIAICANDHREAHYGLSAEALEASFIAAIGARVPRSKPPR